MIFADSLGGSYSVGIGRRPAEGRYYRVSDIGEIVGTELRVRVVDSSFCHFVSQFVNLISIMIIF